jgi:hypothetical protein
MILSRGPQQSTYFSFVPVESCIEFKFIYLTFRFNEATNRINLTFGIGPETHQNRRIRNKVLRNRDRFNHLSTLNSRGIHYVGLVQKSIDFSPVGINLQQLEFVVRKVFESHVVEFVEQVKAAFNLALFS